MADHPPIHEPKGVSYWDENLGEYILDPTPNPYSRPKADIILKGWQPGDITD